MHISPMPMIHKGALLLVFMFLSSALFAYTIVIAPEAFNRMIETSSPILKSINICLAMYQHLDLIQLLRMIIKIV